MQLWQTPDEGGYLWSPNLSKTLRMQQRALAKFRQLADAQDAVDSGLGRGDTFFWNAFTPVAQGGRKLSETENMPETSFKVKQRSLKIDEWGNSVPYTFKLDALAAQNVKSIIDKVLKFDARDTFDVEVFNKLRSTPLVASPTGGTATNSVVVSQTGIPATTNNVELGIGHVKAISDWMKEWNIPPYIADDYVAVSHVTTLRPFKDELEGVFKYTEAGIGRIFNGEIGRYESCRFIEQNLIKKGGAYNSATYDPRSTAAPWQNGKSSWAFFMGGDTVTEAVVIPEEIRAKLPGDYGRSRGIAWYGLCGFGLVHPEAEFARVVQWGSLN